MPKVPTRPLDQGCRAAQAATSPRSAISARGVLDDPLAAGGAAAARVHLEQDVAPAVEVGPLPVDEAVRPHDVQRGQGTQSPARAVAAPVAGGLHQHGPAVPLPVIRRQPDVDGDLHAVPHRDVDRGLAPQAGRRQLLARQQAASAPGRRRGEGQPDEHQRSDLRLRVFHDGSSAVGAVRRRSRRRGLVDVRRSSMVRAISGNRLRNAGTRWPRATKPSHAR